MIRLTTKFSTRYRDCPSLLKFQDGVEVGGIVGWMKVNGKIL